MPNLELLVPERLSREESPARDRDRHDLDQDEAAGHLGSDRRRPGPRRARREADLGRSDHDRDGATPEEWLAA